MGPEPADETAGGPHGPRWGPPKLRRAATPRVGLRSREGPRAAGGRRFANQQVSNPQPRPAGQLPQDQTFRTRRLHFRREARACAPQGRAPEAAAVRPLRLPLRRFLHAKGRRTEPAARGPRGALGWVPSPRLAVPTVPPPPDSLEAPRRCQNVTGAVSAALTAGPARSRRSSSSVSLQAVPRARPSPADATCSTGCFLRLKEERQLRREEHRLRASSIPHVLSEELNPDGVTC